MKKLIIALILTLSIGTVYDMSANDYVEVVVLQTSGGALNLEAQANHSPEFSAVRIG